MVTADVGTAVFFFSLPSRWKWNIYAEVLSLEAMSWNLHCCPAHYSCISLGSWKLELEDLIFNMEYSGKGFDI